MLYLSIILLSWLVWCVNGRPLPCTMVDETKGAMLCCDYQPLPHEEGLTRIKAQSNQVLQSDKKCTLITPKSSLGLVKEVWSLRNYSWAAGMLKTKLPITKDIPRWFMWAIIMGILFSGQLIVYVHNFTDFSFRYHVQNSI